MSEGGAKLSLIPFSWLAAGELELIISKVTKLSNPILRNVRDYAMFQW